MNFMDNLYILDGGLATEIERRGINITDDPLWSARILATDPQLICDIHKSYLEHGADIITTASYQASIEGFSEHLKVTAIEGLSLIGQSVSLAKEAREWFLQQPESQGRMAPLIAGSVGPRGACLHDGSEYNGHYVDTCTHEALKEWHRPRVTKLLDTGVDVLAIETIPALKEAEVLVDLLKEFPHAKAWISFSCKDGLHTCHGEVFSDVVKFISQSPQIVAVGVNCTSPQYVEELLNNASGCEKPLIAYPNSGEEWHPGSSWYGKKMVTSTCSTSWIKLGAKIIGGCCRVTPEDINQIRRILYNK